MTDPIEQRLKEIEWEPDEEKALAHKAALCKALREQHKLIQIYAGDRHDADILAILSGEEGQK